MDRIRTLGDRPESFIKLIRTLIYGIDPTNDNNILQEEALRNLEQLKLGHIQYFTEYSKDFARYTIEAQKAFDPEICNKYFDKIPGELGKILKKIVKSL